VSKQTISAIADRVMEEIAAWQSWPLDRVYPVIFIDCVNVKIREGNVANRPIYVALAVTCEGTRDILGLWAGEHGDREGFGKYWMRGPVRDQEPGHPRLPDRRLRRSEGPARGGDHCVAPDDHANMRRPSVAQFVQG
jgi:Transposase, Mutator family